MDTFHQVYVEKKSSYRDDLIFIVKWDNQVVVKLMCTIELSFISVLCSVVSKSKYSGEMEHHYPGK